MAETQSNGEPHIVEPASRHKFAEASSAMRAAIKKLERAISELSNPGWPNYDRLAHEAVETYKMWANNEREEAIFQRKRAEKAEAELAALQQATSLKSTP